MCIKYNGKFLIFFICIDYFSFWSTYASIIKTFFFWRRYASITLETTILAFYYNLLIYIYIGNLSHSNLPCSKSMPTHNRPRVAIIQLSKEGFSFSNNSLLPPTNNTCTQSLCVAFACTIFLLYTTYSDLFPFRKFLGFFLLH